MEIDKIQTAADLENAFLTWHELLYRYVFARLRDREASEDILQEVFMKVWRKRESFDPQKSSLKNWLFVITINTLRDHFRSKKQQHEELEENIGSDFSLEKAFTEHDLVNYVFDQAKQLPERDQELLFLRYTEDLSLQEIADVLKMNYSAVKVAMHRALQKLKVYCQEKPQ